MNPHEQQMYHQFFLNGVPIQQDIRPSNPNLDYNLQVFEIVNNWELINEAYNKYKNGTLKKVDPIENDCLNFIINCSINLESYENSDDFIKLVCKELA